MTDTPDLARMQRWMQAVITHPEGVAGGAASAEARDAIDVEHADLERVLTRSRALPAADRLAVYANAYYSRLLECLREEFPALVYLLDTELFDEFAIGYLQQYPSRSYTLHHLGTAFPQYLAESCPDDEDPRWVALMVDLATLERVYGDVFDGPGNERLEMLSAERLAAIPPEAWATARLIPAPDVRLLELRSAVHEFARSVRRKEEPELPDPEETLLVVHRRDYVVRRHQLTRAQYVLLGAILAGETVGDAIGRAAEVAEPEVEDFGLALREWFRDWAAEGLFQSVEM